MLCFMRQSYMILAVFGYGYAFYLISALLIISYGNNLFLMDVWNLHSNIIISLGVNKLHARFILHNPYEFRLIFASNFLNHANR
jgi:hypothetical protein